MTKSIISKEFMNKNVIKEHLNTNSRFSSKDGYIQSDIDQIWRNYKNKLFLLAEHKCRLAEPSYSQLSIFSEMDRYLSLSPNYLGIFLIQLGGETILDGKIYIAGKEVNLEQLDNFFAMDIKNKKLYEHYRLKF